MLPRPLQRGPALLILLISGLSIAPAFAQSDTVQPNRPIAIPTAPSSGPAETEVPPKPVLRQLTAPIVAAPEPLPAQESLPLGGLPANRAQASSLPAEGPAGGSWILQTITALGIVLGLIFGLRYLLQRITGLRSAPTSGRLVEVLARSPIAPRTHLLFLRIQQRIIVACQSPAGLQTLTELTDPTEIVGILTQVQMGRSNSISDSFRQLLGRQDANYAPADDAEIGAENSLDRTRHEVSGLLARIRNLKRGGDQ